MGRMESAKELQVSPSFGLSLRRHHAFDVSRDGRVLELPIAAEDMTVSRLSQVFQASTDCVYIWILAKSPDDITATVHDKVILNKI